MSVAAITNYHQFEEPKTKDTYSKAVLEARSLKSGCQKGCTLLKVQERALPCLFQEVLVAPGAPWLVVASLSSLLHLHTGFCSLSVFSFPSLIRTLFTDPGSPGWSHLKILNKVTVRFYGLGHGHIFWKSIIQPTTQRVRQDNLKVSCFWINSIYK